jgi:hypothetical protein
MAIDKDYAYEISQSGLQIENGCHFTSGADTPTHAAVDGDIYLKTVDATQWYYMSGSWHQRTTSGGGSLSEVSSDPVSPSAGDTWILNQAAGSPIGLLLALTTEASKYYLSYKTASGAVVRTQLS